jgi:DNA polymerase III delta subunit
MKLFILHGDNLTDSYARLAKFISAAKKRGWEIVKVNEELKSLSEVLVSQNLFVSEKLVIIENINKVSAKNLKWLKNNIRTLEGNLVVYHPAILNKTQIDKLPKPDKTEEFKHPKLLWSFLDSVYPGNARNTIILFEKVVETEPEELVFAMLARHLRDLYWAKTDYNSMNLPAWRKGKLKNQANKYTDGKLEEIISYLAEIDVLTKTSDTGLKKELDFLLARELV